MKVLTQFDEKLKSVCFEAEDVNDPDWQRIIEVLYENGIITRFGDGNWMNFTWEEEWEDEI